MDVADDSVATGNSLVAHEVDSGILEVLEAFDILLEVEDSMNYLAGLSIDFQNC